MTLQEASQRFCISMESLQLYVENGLLAGTITENGISDYKERELDVVVQEPDGTIVICEVKTRAEGSLTTPAEAVNRAKQRRLIRAAEAYLQRMGLSDAPVRFDVAEVNPLDSGRWMVHIIRGAFLA